MGNCQELQAVFSTKRILIILEDTAIHTALYIPMMDWFSLPMTTIQHFMKLSWEESKMKQYYVDFTKAKTMWYFHEAWQKGLQPTLDGTVGKNLDALWDCLTDMETPCKVTLKGLDKLPRDLKDEANTMLKIFERAVEWYKEISMHFEFEVID